MQLKVTDGASDLKSLCFWIARRKQALKRKIHIPVSVIQIVGRLRKPEKSKSNVVLWHYLCRGNDVPVNILDCHAHWTTLN